MKIKDLFLQNDNLYLGIRQPYGNTEWAGCRAIVSKNYKGELTIKYEPYDEEGSNYKDGEIVLSFSDMAQLNNSVQLLAALLETEVKEESK